MSRRILFSVAFALLTCAAISAEVVKQPVADVTVRLARVPDRIGTPVALDAEGRFQLADAVPGTWTAIVSAPEDYLETWVDRELGKRNWKRGPAPVKGAKPAAVQDRSTPADNASREYRVIAHDAQGKNHEIEFSMSVTMHGVFGDGNHYGDYVKPMRFHQLEKGLWFKFHLGRGGSGREPTVLRGRVQRVVTIDGAAVSARGPARPK